MECSVPFSLLEPHHCDLTGSTFNSEPASSIRPPPTSAKRQRKEEKKQKEREKRSRRELNTEEEVVDGRVKEEEEQTTKPSSSLPREEPEKIQHTEISPDNVIVLTGHQSEVFSCAWNPVVSSLLASGYHILFIVNILMR